jgi:hypothetical protein
LIYRKNKNSVAKWKTVWPKLNPHGLGRSESGHARQLNLTGR